jgi:uncharacterized protein (UPF0305 family)
MTLQQIYERANVLAENNFAELEDVVGHLNAAQSIISRFDPIKSEPYYTMVTENGIMLPSDLLKVYRIYVDDEPYQPIESAWGSTIPDLHLPLGAVVKILYYAKPPDLMASAPYMEPRVYRHYHEAMAQYAAKMFYLIDDDPPLRDAFNSEFMTMLGSLKTSDGVVQRFSNYF